MYKDHLFYTSHMLTYVWNLIRFVLRQQKQSVPPSLVWSVVERSKVMQKGSATPELARLEISRGYQGSRRTFKQ